MFTIQTFGPDSDSLSKQARSLLMTVSRPRARLNGLQIQWLSRPLTLNTNSTQSITTQGQINVKFDYIKHITTTTTTTIFTAIIQDNLRYPAPRVKMNRQAPI